MIFRSFLIALFVATVKGPPPNSRPGTDAAAENVEPKRNQTVAGGHIKIDFMHDFSSIGASMNFNKDDSTMFTRSAPYPPPEGVWGELVPFFPLDACSPLKESNYTRKSGNGLQLTTIGPYPHVIALVARGNCSFEDKFDHVDDIPNVIGMIMYDLPHGAYLSNDIEIATYHETTIPGFLIDHTTGKQLLERVHEMRVKHAQNEEDSPNEPEWIKVMFKYIVPSPVANILQFSLLVIVILLTVAFATSVYMHYRIYRLQQRLGQDRESQARNEITIDEGFLQKLPSARFKRTIQMTDVGAGVSHSGLPKSALADDNPRSPVAPIEEMEEGIIHAHAPPNETCPICLDEFEEGELLNVLPCGHYYHMTCIHPWLQTRSPCCPMCKEDVRDSYIEQRDEEDAEIKTRWQRAKEKIMFILCCSYPTNPCRFGSSSTRPTTPTVVESPQTAIIFTPTAAAGPQSRTNSDIITTVNIPL